ncbi:universal stress protein [Nocardioides limicola]|uniref:universal stress protein n=1 Tax=Nocardioides limicola TaxID=2803368 RepID=UPI00193C8117|nr:universal stress protein [Nocardioides sp. DJM-14]
MNDNAPQTIVVGVDGSDASRAALTFAVQEALLRGANVEVVTAWSTPTYEESILGLQAAALRERAEESQEALIKDVVGGLERTPDIIRTVEHTDAGQLLVDRSADGAMLVVGATDKGRLSRAVLGSASTYAVRHAKVPVVVVPDQE